MSSARVMDQVVATMPARIGLLSNVADALGAAGVNISAIDAYERNGVGTFMLVTDDPDKAAEALRAMEADVSARTVVAVEMPDRPGALSRAAHLIADAGINVFFAHGSVSPGASRAVVVLGTADDHRAAALF